MRLLTGVWLDIPNTPAEVNVNGESKETRAVMRALQTETDMWTQAGERFPMDTVEGYAAAAKRWLGDNSECSGREIDNADYSVALEFFREVGGWVDPQGSNPLKSETQEPSGKGHEMTDSKLITTASRAAVHFVDNVEKCNTIKRGSVRNFEGYPVLTIHDAREMKPCANCKDEVTAEMERLEALDAIGEEAQDAQEAEEAQDAAEGSQELEDAQEDQEDAEEVDTEALEAEAAKTFGVNDPWKALENWERLARSAKANGNETGYDFWHGKAEAIGAAMGAE